MTINDTIAFSSFLLLVFFYDAKNFSQICTRFHISMQYPEYNQGPGFSPNDIAVVTSTELISGTNVSPGTIAPNADNPGGTGWITGWGRLCGGYSARGQSPPPRNISKKH